MAALRNLLSFSSSFSQLAIRSASTSRSLSTFRPRFQTLASGSSRHFSASPSSSATMQQVLHGARRRLPKISKVPLLENHFQKKGVCSKVYTTKPKKPNSAVRKVARVKLSTGESTVCYIPGEGHNLQEHSVVMVRGGRVRDLPGVRYKLIRGAQDLGAVAGRVKGRSKYGAKKPKTNK